MQTEKLQIGVVVEDLEKAIHKAEQLFSIRPWQTLDVPEAGVRAAIADWAGVEIELIAAANEVTREQHRKTLRGKSARFTHVGAYVADKDAEVERLGELGVPVVYRDIGGEEVRTAMVDVRNEAGYMLELLQRIS
ncbi:MAG: VOC family protein [Halieaceae bacterium]|nr:VOC family protein [Halieaceae bacterium]